jgi:hypothetical protein
MKLRSRSSVLRWSGIVLRCCLGVGVPAVAAEDKARIADNGFFNQS